MFDDLLKTIKAQLYDRIASPLFSSYLISWVGWNYKFLLTLFSGMKVKEKLDFISSVVYPSFNYLLLHGALYPLITSMLIIFVYPYPAKFTYEFHRRRQVELKEIQQKIDDETPITREEAKKIRTDALIMSIDFEKEIEKLREENVQLRRLVKDSQVVGANEDTAGNETRQIDKGDVATPVEFGNAESQFSEVITPEENVVSSSHRKRLNEDASFNYVPFFKDDEENRKSRLLVTGPELIKASVENLINSEPIFDGHSFMVNLDKDEDKNKVVIILFSKIGGMKKFEYDFHVPSDGRVGYENLRIKTAFENDFIEFLKKNKKHVDDE
ncbi:hypothetical protein A7P61_07305 [Pantoea agglomerans pv. betae]|uniref:hypothetical protein n=1 Tax=Enterobacter agglomerans TaxID=549 RepID=UPI0007E57273|nr:hypothetical protein [Pantoea agglomerans]WHU84795.1 hypothetical protein A7P61_07305 [Pantoea agglomerans pv. betae]